MNSLVSFIAILVFFGAQGFTVTCVADCLHHQKTRHVLGRNGHGCCDKVKNKMGHKKSLHCEAESCSKLLPLQQTKSDPNKQYLEKLLNDVYGVVEKKVFVNNTPSPRLANILKKRPFVSIKLPLYIAYKKLLLP